MDTGLKRWEITNYIIFHLEKGLKSYIWVDNKLKNNYTANSDNVKTRENEKK